MPEFYSMLVFEQDLRDDLPLTKCPSHNTVPSIFAADLAIIRFQLRADHHRSDGMP